MSHLAQTSIQSSYLTVAIRFGTINDRTVGPLRRGGSGWLTVSVQAPQAGHGFASSSRWAYPAIVAAGASQPMAQLSQRILANRPTADS